MAAALFTEKFVVFGFHPVAREGDCFRALHWTRDFRILTEKQLPFLESDDEPHLSLELKGLTKEIKVVIKLDGISNPQMLGKCE